MSERGATETEVIGTIQSGEKFPAKYGRTGFRRNFASSGIWRNKEYRNKQIEVYAVEEGDCWLVVTVIVKYF